MKTRIAVAVALLSLGRTFAQGTALDLQFGTGGKVATDVSTYSDEQATDVAVQSDGKIVAGGYSGAGQTQSASAYRYLADGSVDAGFGTGGRVLLSGGAGYNNGFGVGIQKINGTERILLANNYFDGNNIRFLVIGRFLPNGTPDATFGTNGVVKWPNMTGQKMIVDTLGRLLMPGTNNSMGGATQFGVMRFLANGKVDSSFGVAGFASRPDPLYAAATCVVCQKDGKIIVGGFTYTNFLSNKFDLGFVRYGPTGKVDSSFGTAGLTVISPDTNNAEVHSLAMQPDGKILACGISNIGTGDQFYVTRLLPSGVPDPSFGTGGGVRTSFGASQSWANTVLLQEDGKIYAVGQAAPYNSVPPYLFAIARYKADGSVDSTFGTAGRDTSTIGNYCGSVAAVITPGKKVVAAGWSYWSVPLGRFHDYALMQYNSGLAVTPPPPPPPAPIGIQPVEALQVSVAPNPAHATVAVSYELKQADRLSVQLLDLAGRTVQVFRAGELRRAGAYREVFPISEAIPTGSYILQVAGEGVRSRSTLQVVR